MEGQISIFDIIKFPAEKIAMQLNNDIGTKFEKVLDDGYYLLFVYSDQKHRYVIDGSRGRLGFGIDGFFLSSTGYNDIKARYFECINKMEG